jgi:hypothetical protein
MDILYALFHMCLEKLKLSKNFIADMTFNRLFSYSRFILYLSFIIEFLFNNDFILEDFFS